MKNLWFINPATYTIQGDKILATYLPVRPRDLRYKNNAYSLDVNSCWESWLESFASIDDRSKLLVYLEQNGFPYKNHDQNSVAEESEAKFLGAASFINWIITLLDLVRPHKRSDIKGRCKIESISEPDADGCCSAIIVPKDCKNWKGFQKLGVSNESTLVLRVSGYSKDDFRKGRWEIDIAACREYVFAAINLLMEGISLRIQRNFNAEFSPKTPYEAMCLALFAKATGTTVSHVCKRAGCPNLVFSSVSVNGGRKPREDRLYCSGKCRHYVYDAKKRRERAS
ncbi:MAG: hypothetical protein KGS72_20520 [Cyanobacteria bacterium REEB67]|nr:hypothetical protein [Cyanobacteria bacterium REEB67]